jgi:phage baseplate assembly protein W
VAEPFKVDLRLHFHPQGWADLSVEPGDLDTVSGRDNLAQALTLRLIVSRGELGGLGHPRYGSRVHELFGKPIDAANLELLRRFVRHALLGDPRVAEVTRVDVQARRDAPGAVEVEASVRPVEGEPIGVRVMLDVG